MKHNFSIYFDVKKMNPETLAHNLRIAEDLCAGTGRAKLFSGGEYVGRLIITDKRLIVVHVFSSLFLFGVMEILEGFSFTGPILVHAEGWTEAVEQYLNLYGEFDFGNAIPEPEPVSINRVYVSVFSDKFLIDSDGVLYARNLNGDRNLCMHTEAGNLYTVIGWDLDCEPCTITDSCFEDLY